MTTETQVTLTLTKKEVEALYGFLSKYSVENKPEEEMLSRFLRTLQGSCPCLH